MLDDSTVLDYFMTKDVDWENGHLLYIFLHHNVLVII